MKSIHLITDLRFQGLENLLKSPEGYGAIVRIFSGADYTELERQTNVTSSIPYGPRLGPSWTRLGLGWAPVEPNWGPFGNDALGCIESYAL